MSFRERTISDRVIFAGDSKAGFCDMEWLFGSHMSHCSPQGLNMYSPDTIYIIGIAKAQQNNPITQQYGRFLLGFVVNKDSGVIENCGSTVVMKSTYDFLDDLFRGKNIETDSDAIRHEIENRYFGASQKAIMVAFRDAQRRFRMFKQGIRGDSLTRQDELSANPGVDREK